VSALGGREVAQLMSGEVIGEMSLSIPIRRRRPVQALERSAVLVVPRARLSAKLNDDYGLRVTILPGVGRVPGDRLRSTVATLGYSSNETLDQDKLYRDEIDPETLDAILARRSTLRVDSEEVCGRFEDGELSRNGLPETTNLYAPRRWSASPRRQPGTAGAGVHRRELECRCWVTGVLFALGLSAAGWPGQDVPTSSPGVGCC